MSEDKRPPSLEELGERLRRAQENRRPGRQPESQTRQFGVGYRVLVEMLAGVLVGAGLGWFFDQLFGTRPWLLIAMLILGFAAGISNAYRVTRRIAAEAEARYRSDEPGNGAGSG